MRRGGGNEVGDVIVPSATQNLEPVFDFRAEENAIE